MYPLAVGKKITQTPEYKECFQLLNFQSKEELCSKLEKIVDYLSNNVKSSAKNKIMDVIEKLNKFLSDINSFNMDDLEEAVNEIEDVDVQLQGSSDRKQFREVNHF